MPNKSFMVVDGELRLQITPDSGWYCVEGLDIRGLITQGRTIEEAIANAHDAAQALAESRAIMAAEKAGKARKAKKTCRDITAKARTMPRRQPKRQPVAAE